MNQAALLETMVGPTVDRKFWLILALSLALHGSLFALTSWQRQHQPLTRPPLLASIRLLPPSIFPIEPAAVVAEVPAPAAVLPKVRQQARSVPRPTAPQRLQSAGPANVPASSPPPPVAPASVATTATSPAVAVAASSLATAAVAVPAAAASAMAAPPSQNELLAGYRQRLSALFASQHSYPRVAALRGWEGEVRLRLKVARKGNLITVQLDRSSGFDVLDQHALAMLEAYASLPALPDGLDASEIQVVVPINYKLRKTT